MPLNPTEQEREKAFALLLSAIGEFPYVSDADKANALGLLLTPILRPAIKRHVALGADRCTKARNRERLAE